jgi:histidinol-phosphate/aromatic aminotransferase/cobyric acid decarboxylase-like protein
VAALALSAELKPLAAETIGERVRVRDALLELGIACPPSQTNFVFADLGERDLDLFAELAARGVVVRRLGQFGAAAATYRITVGTPAENDQLIAALTAVLGSNPAAGRGRSQPR